MKHTYSQVWSLALQALLVVAEVAVLSTAACAHAVLVASSPKDNSVVTVAPKTVMLRFDARIEKRVTQVTLLDANRHKVVLPPAPHGYTSGPPDRLIIAMPNLKPGSYRLEYRVMATDGHLTPGLVRFTIAARKTK
jgi:methionine-rich copper-binding protein CopC